MAKWRGRTRTRKSTRNGEKGSASFAHNFIFVFRCGDQNKNKKKILSLNTISTLVSGNFEGVQPKKWT
jgi:hypothetical protein